MYEVEIPHLCPDDDRIGSVTWAVLRRTLGQERDVGRFVFRGWTVVLRAAVREVVRGVPERSWVARQPARLPKECVLELSDFPFSLSLGSRMSYPGRR